MDLFNCRVRLGGRVEHDVPRKEISEKEVQLLREIHGADAVFEVKKVSSIARDEADELMDLARRYTKERVESCFKIKLDNFDGWLQEQLAKADAEAEIKDKERREPQQPQPAPLTTVVSSPKK